MIPALMAADAAPASFAPATLARRTAHAYTEARAVMSTPEQAWAHRLRAALSQYLVALDAPAPTGYPNGRLIAATGELQSTWMAFAAALSDPRSALRDAAPAPRARLLGLAQFVLEHGSAVVTGTGDAAAIADVTRSTITRLESRC